MIRQVSSDSVLFAFPCPFVLHGEPPPIDRDGISAASGGGRRSGHDITCDAVSILRDTSHERNVLGNAVFERKPARLSMGLAGGHAGTGVVTRWLFVPTSGSHTLLALTFNPKPCRR